MFDNDEASSSLASSGQSTSLGTARCGAPGRCSVGSGVCWLGASWSGGAPASATGKGYYLGVESRQTGDSCREGVVREVFNYVHRYHL